MTTETISRLVDELAHAYPGATCATENQLTLVKLPEVFFPKGGSFDSTTALVVLDPQQATPKLLLARTPPLPNGAGRKNVNAETFAGEGWFTFSFSQPWDEGTHTAVQFVEGRLRRFALNE